nr:DNA-3-methyladenine glycosylase [Streptomyces bungoensis]
MPAALSRGPGHVRLTADSPASRPQPGSRARPRCHLVRKRVPSSNGLVRLEGPYPSASRQFLGPWGDARRALRRWGRRIRRPGISSGGSGSAENRTVPGVAGTDHEQLRAFDEPGAASTGRSALREHFFDRPALEVAPELLGALVVSRSQRGVTAVRMTEVEAYEGPDAWRGRRGNEPGPSGTGNRAGPRGP